MRAREPALGESLWAATATGGGEYPPLEGEQRADVAIIGAGFTGASAALHLAGEGVDALVLEAAEVGWGGSGRNAGLVNAGLWLDPDEVVRRVGREHGPRFVEVFGRLPELVFELVEKYGIDCDLERKGVVRAAHSARALRALEAHVRQWRERGAAVEMLDGPRTAEMLGSERYRGALIDHRSATVQPLSYARGLARAATQEGARIHCDSRVIAMRREGGGWRLKTPRGEVRAEQVILATNAYSDDLWPGVRRSTIPIGCFAYATAPLGENVRNSVLPAGHAVYDTQPAMYFMRKDGEGRLLMGSLGYLPPADPARAGAWVNRAARWLFPQLGDPRWIFRWAGTIGFTPDHIPRVCELEPGLHMALGYNGRGIAPGTFWGKMLAARVRGAPASELPLPATALRPIRFRGLWQLFYETCFRAYRLRRILD